MALGPRLPSGDEKECIEGSKTDGNDRYCEGSGGDSVCKVGIFKYYFSVGVLECWSVSVSVAGGHGALERERGGEKMDGA